MPCSDTSSTSSGSDTYEYRPVREHNRVARKSTAAQAPAAPASAAPAHIPVAPTGNYTTRRQAALANSGKSAQQRHNKNLRSGAERFLENFNPDTSTREKRKLIRKITQPSSNVRRPPGAQYDEHAIHIATGIDLCDCLNEDCLGCFFECERCGSQKCGIDCRVHRKYLYDQIEYHGYDIIIKNPLMKH